MEFKQYLKETFVECVKKVKEDDSIPKDKKPSEALGMLTTLVLKNAKETSLQKSK